MMHRIFTTTFASVYPHYVKKALATVVVRLLGAPRYEMISGSSTRSTTVPFTTLTRYTF